MCIIIGTRQKNSDYDIVVNNDTWENEWLENFRKMIEECDSLKHISIINDGYNAFSGVVSTYMQDLYDEMLTKSVSMVCIHTVW